MTNIIRFGALGIKLGLSDEQVDLHDTLVDRRDQVGVGLAGQLSRPQVSEQRVHLIPLLAQVREDHRGARRLEAHRSAAGEHLHRGGVDAGKRGSPFIPLPQWDNALAHDAAPAGIQAQKGGFRRKPWDTCLKLSVYGDGHHTITICLRSPPFRPEFTLGHEPELQLIAIRPMMPVP